jgi:hypothetical protein
MTKNIFYIFLFILSSCITINKEDFNFTSKHNYVNAYDLSETIGKNKEDLVCIIISPSCSGVDNFFPEVAKDVERFKKDGVKSRVIIQMLNLSSSENYLDSLCSKYNLQHSLDIIDHKVHPAGGLKRKYNNFLTNLCGKCNNKSLGYPFYIYYKEGKYIDKSYYLSEELYQKIKN